MKFSLVALLPLGGFFGQTVASPVAAPAQALEKRQDVDVVVSLETLHAEIQVHTGNINATIDGLEDSVASLLGTAMSTQIIGQELTAIIGLVNNATDGSAGLKPSAGGVNVIKRQAGAEAVVALIGLIFSDISGTLNNIIDALGIDAFLAFLNPLGTALSNLVLSLENVVDQLLALVKELLDGILNSLAAALGGFDFGL